MSVVVIRWVALTALVGFWFFAIKFLFFIYGGK